MKLSKVGYAIFLGATLLSAEAMADCEGENPDFEAVSATILYDKGIDATAPGVNGENWKEDHCLNGLLIKVGDGSPVDPRKEVGTWSPTRNPAFGVSYSYHGIADPYVWLLFSTGSAIGDEVCWEEQDTGEVIAVGEIKALSGACFGL